jgi:hypothetical protein
MWNKRHGLSLQLIEVKLFIYSNQDMEQDGWDKDTHTHTPTHTHTHTHMLILLNKTFKFSIGT